MSKTYGYARCSTNEDKQDINRQIRELKEAGAEEVVFEYEHGDAKVKRNLQLTLDNAQPGDTIITVEVSRLSRSTQQLCEILDTVKNKCLRLVILGSITVDWEDEETVEETSTPEQTPQLTHQQPELLETSSSHSLNFEEIKNNLTTKKDMPVATETTLPTLPTDPAQ